jgi:hypothetical protein
MTPSFESMMFGWFDSRFSLQIVAPGNADSVVCRSLRGFFGTRRWAKEYPVSALLYRRIGLAGQGDPFVKVSSVKTSSGRTIARLMDRRI